jgi:hypothetical protein
MDRRSKRKDIMKRLASLDDEQTHLLWTIMSACALAALCVGYSLYSFERGAEAQMLLDWARTSGFNLMRDPDLGPGSLWWALLGAIGGASLFDLTLQTAAAGDNPTD